MKLLITGDRGQLGAELKRVLSLGYTELGNIPEALKAVQVIAVDINELDITNQEVVNTFIRMHRPEIIINCAAFTDVDKCETNADAAMEVNAVGPRNLAIAAEEFGAKLMHISTDHVFSGDESVPYSEWDIPSPRNIYGHSKLLGEQYVRQFCQKSFIVRTAWLYGYVGNNFVKSILRAARKTEKLKIVNDQRGNPTNAADLAHHLLKLAVTDGYGLYHCTNKGECSRYEFACEFLKLSGLDYKIIPCTTREYPRPAKRPACSSLDNRMFRVTAGDEMRSWQDAITAYICHYDRDMGEITVRTNKEGCHI
jgi:dTDP-4-dehydrorhamnose reductase